MVAKYMLTPIEKKVDARTGYHPTFEETMKKIEMNKSEAKFASPGAASIYKFGFSINGEELPGRALPSAALRW